MNAILVLATLGVATLSVRLAQAAEELGFSAPGACPTKAAFVSAVEARSEHQARDERDLEVRLLRVSIEAGDAGWSGSLEWLTRDQAVAVRHVEARDCAEVFDALVLMAAFALDTTPGATAAGPAGDASPAHGSDEEQRGAELPTSATSAAPARTARHSAPGSWDDGEPGDWADVALPSLLPRTEPGWGLGAALTARSGISPELSPGAELVVQFASGGSWYLRGAFGAARSGHVHSNEREAEFAWLGGSADACLLLVPAAGVCLSYDAGTIAAQGLDTAVTQGAVREMRGWMAVGPALRARVPLGRAFRLDFGLASLYTLLRPAFWYGGDSVVLVHRTPELALAATAGGEFFWGTASRTGSK